MFCLHANYYYSKQARISLEEIYYKRMRVKEKNVKQKLTQLTSKYYFQFNNLFLIKKRFNQFTFCIKNLKLNVHTERRMGLHACTD